MITERILKLIEYKGLTKSSFYRKTGLSNGFLDKVKDIGVTKLELILKCFPDVNLEWLVYGEGNMIKYQQDTKSTSVLLEPKTEYLAVDDKSIPLVYGTAVGGFGGSQFSIDKADVKEYYVIPKFKNKKIDFMIEVEGSSMYPKYNSGDIVACRIINERNFIQWNKTHVIATKDQGILIKRIKPSKKKDLVTIVSDNRDYDPFEVNMEEVTGLAIVVGVIRLE